MKIKIESAPEKIVKLILADIKSGKWKPGDKLPNHQEMADQYGVGRSSIREAINALAVMDLVVAMQGKGTFVKKKVAETTPPSNDLDEIFMTASVYNLMEIREVLECHSVRKAAKVISEDQIVLLKEAYKRLEKCYKEVNLYLNEDINFHMAIANAAKNPELGKILRALHLKVNHKTSVILKTSSTGNVRKAITTAKDILNFIIAGEGYRAERVMREHLGIAKEAFLKALFDENEASLPNLSSLLNET
jgi:GntR family transcriptional repressor for pyruvate dehydrogenase complex